MRLASDWLIWLLLLFLLEDDMFEVPGGLIGCRLLSRVFWLGGCFGMVGNITLLILSLYLWVWRCYAEQKCARVASYVFKPL